MHNDLINELEVNGFVIDTKEKDYVRISKNLIQYKLMFDDNLMKLQPAFKFINEKSGFVIRNVCDANEIHNQICSNAIKRRHQNLLNHLKEFGYNPIEFSTKYNGMTYSTFVVLRIYPFYSIHRNPFIRIDRDETGLLTVSDTDKILGVASNFKDLGVLLDFYFKGE